MANEEKDRPADDREKRASRPPAGDSRPAETGKSKGYTRPSRDSVGRPPRSSDARPPRTDRGSSSSSRPLNSSSRPPSNGAGGYRGTSPRDGGDSRGYQGRPDSAGVGRPDRGGSDRPNRGDSRGYQGRPDRSGSDRPDRGAPRRDGGDARGYQGRPDRAGSSRPDRAGGDRPPQRTGYLGKGAPKHKGAAQRDGDDRAPRNEGLVRQAPVAPDIPDEITFDLLDKSARASLRTLSKDNAEDVGRHLVMAGRLIDIDPERAYQHAQVAVARGGRVDICREAAALTAYATARYADALREFRTVRRLNSSSEHLPLMADCERGLGRPERAIALAQEPEAQKLSAEAAVELQIVIAGARLDMGNAEAALMTLSRIETKNSDARVRISEAKVAVLRALERNDEADKIQASLPVEGESEPTWADEVYLYDTEELPEPLEYVASDEESGTAQDSSNDEEPRNV